VNVDLSSRAPVPLRSRRLLWVGLAGAALGYGLFLGGSCYALFTIYAVQMRHQVLLHGQHGYAGLRPLAFAASFSPLYLLAFCFFFKNLAGRRGDAVLAAVYANVLCVPVSVALVCLAWGLIGMGKVAASVVPDLPSP